MPAPTWSSLPAYVSVHFDTLTGSRARRPCIYSHSCLPPRHCDPGAPSCSTVGAPSRVPHPLCQAPYRRRAPLSRGPGRDGQRGHWPRVLMTSQIMCGVFLWSARSRPRVDSCRTVKILGSSSYPSQPSNLTSIPNRG